MAVSVIVVVRIQNLISIQGEYRFFECRKTGSQTESKNRFIRFFSYRYTTLKVAPMIYIFQRSYTAWRLIVHNLLSLLTFAVAVAVAVGVGVSVALAAGVAFVHYQRIPVV